MFVKPRFNYKFWFIAKLGVFVAICIFVVFASKTSFALPWDVDMYRQPSLKSGEIARSPAKGSVPVGYQPFPGSLEEAAKDVRNPVPMSRHSAWRGRRLWNVHCSVCHGKWGDGKGSVGPLIGAVNLLGDIYKTKTDGRIYSVIHFGLRAMPRQGYKLSPAERWDIVNYLRVLQGKDIQGMGPLLDARPTKKKD